MKNNKGFSLVELLAVVVVLGILAMIGTMAYTSYIESSRLKAYDTLARSASEAAAEYTLDHFNIESITLEELVEFNLLENANDPANKGHQCAGKVAITHKSNDIGLDTEEYDVTLCCKNYSRKYHFPGGKKQEIICTE